MVLSAPCQQPQLRRKIGSEQLKTNKLDCVPAIIGVDDDEEDDDDYYSLDDDGEARVRRVLAVARVIVSEPVDHNRPTSLHTNEYCGLDGVVAPWGPTGKRGSSTGDTLRGTLHSVRPSISYQSKFDLRITLLAAVIDAVIRSSTQQHIRQRTV
ncbi:hypothetical protein EDD15DRAFT_1013847 [Pisolithus albus]|nr:hypothetical protein EDD15DRAFT_1013847 [Pisolithus albus]